MSGLFGDLWDKTAGGLMWKPLKKATGLTDAQMIGLGAMAVAAPFALPALGGAGAAGAAGAAEAGAAAGSGASLTGGAVGFSGGQAAAPIVELSTPATQQTISGLSQSGGGGGLLRNAATLSQIGANSGVLGAQPQAPMQAPQLPQFQDVSGGLLGGLDEMQQKRLARRGLLEDGYGAA